MSLVFTFTDDDDDQLSVDLSTDDSVLISIGKDDGNIHSYDRMVNMDRMAVRFLSERLINWIERVSDGIAPTRIEEV